MIVRTLIFACIACTAAAVTTPLAAQEPGETYPGWWFGAYGGINFNLFSGTVSNPSPLPNAVDFTSGSGIGMALGAILEYNGGGFIAGNLMIGYDNRAFDADPVADPAGGEQEFSFSPAYLTIEPNLRFNLGSRWFHLMLGPSIGINAAKGFEYTDPGTSAGVPVSSDMENVRSVVFGGQAGVGYDVPLSSLDARTQVLLTPFAQARVSQDVLDAPSGVADEINLTSIRAGLQIKFGIRPAPAVVGAPPVLGMFDFELRAPGLITESRTLRETFPLRNYLFFDEGSTDIPERYTKMSEGEATTFREEQLLKPAASTGAGGATEVRSREQMQVYYGLLNILGDRLRRNPSASIQLIGAANGDAVKGKLMAENVRAYLIQIFGIDGKRIAAQGQAMPPNRSGGGGSLGEDARLIAQENYRVEIAGPESILRPVELTTLQEEPIENDIVITVPSDPMLESWTVELTRAGGSTQTFGPYRNSSTARIPAKPLLAGDTQAQYEARTVMTMHDGTDIASGTREFRLVRSDAVEEESGVRYSILFEFDESKTVQTYEKFLTESVVPAVPNGSTVIVHGHTDVIGEAEYNAALSQRRVEETQRILTSALTRAGKVVTFDTYGFGEDERRAPFANVQPEHRYYNRTVVIEVLQR